MDDFAPEVLDALFTVYTAYCLMDRHELCWRLPPERRAHCVCECHEPPPEGRHKVIVWDSPFFRY